MIKRPWVIMVLVLSLGILAGCGDSVAKVNGENITQGQLDKIVNLYVSQAQQTYGSDPRQDTEFMKEIRTAAINSLVEQTLLIQEAKKRGMEATDQEVSDQIAAFKEASGDEGYQSFLKASGMTEEDFNAEMYNQILVSELYEKTMEPVSVTAEEIKQYYEDNPQNFGNLREIRVSHILVATKEEAQNLIKRVKAGDDFGELAREFSTEPSAKVTSGDLGFVSEETSFVPEFKTAALKLKPGEITDEPVATEFGFHVIKAFEERAAKVEPFDKVAEQAEAMTLNNKREIVWTELVEKLRSEGNIKIND